MSTVLKLRDETAKRWTRRLVEAIISARNTTQDCQRRLVQHSYDYPLSKRTIVYAGGPAARAAPKPGQDSNPLMVRMGHMFQKDRHLQRFFDSLR
ncbi:hypothetical protein FCJ61_08275 [Burkholderia metallica]|uniref:hypothetical protein n=1 Tax=Burkholderia metallica TaxID=488729 RepID=UPI00157A7D06|nr:hypothetical protein [Burkholderia metallica]NTZ82986.1 hypothetical protein [Burkholderia metallica]